MHIFKTQVTHELIAQSAERQVSNPNVGSSNLTLGRRYKNSRKSLEMFVVKSENDYESTFEKKSPPRCV